MDFTAVEQNLKARGFAVSTFADAASAADYLNAQIDGSSAAFGGSVTLEQLSLYDRLSTHNAVYSHWHAPEGLSADELREKAQTSDHYLLSATALPKRARSSISTVRATALPPRFTGIKRSGSSLGATSLRRPMRKHSGVRATSPRQKTRSVSA